MLINFEIIEIKGNELKVSEYIANFLSVINFIFKLISNNISKKNKII